MLNKIGKIIGRSFLAIIAFILIGKFFPSIIVFSVFAFGIYVLYLSIKFIIEYTRKIEKFDNEDIGNFAKAMNRKFGLVVKKIDENSIKFFGDNYDEREYEGEFYKKVRDLHRFEDEDLPKFIKEQNTKGDYNFIFERLEEMNGDEIYIYINYEEKDIKAVKNAPEVFKKLAETIGVRGTDGQSSLLIHFEEDKKLDTMLLKYNYVDGIDNSKKWNSQIEVIKQIVGFNFVIKNNEAERMIEIKKVPRLKTAIEFYNDGFKWEEFLQKGKIFEGMTSEGAYYRSIKGLTHTGVAGQSGSGKSVQLHQTLKSVFYNDEYFEKIYLGDLKGGLELSFLEDLENPKLSFFGEAHEVLDIVLSCELEMDARMAYMKANRIRNIIGNIQLFIVDEYKQLNDLQMGKSGVSREVGNLIVTKIDRISALGRAMNIKLFLQSQNFTVDSIESSTRNNIQSLVLMKTKNPEIQNACIPFSLREEMPNPAEFSTGKKILLDSETGEVTLIQSLFTEPNEDVSIDNSKLAYELGKEKIEKVKNIEKDVLPFKIKTLERHLENENLIDEARDFYEREYEKLTGKRKEDNKNIEEVKEVQEVKKEKKEDNEKVNNNKKEDNEIMKMLDDLLDS